VSVIDDMSGSLWVSPGKKHLAGFIGNAQNGSLNFGHAYVPLGEIGLNSVIQRWEVGGDLRLRNSRLHPEIGKYAAPPVRDEMS